MGLRGQWKDLGFESEGMRNHAGVKQRRDAVRLELQWAPSGAVFRRPQGKDGQGYRPGGLCDCGTLGEKRGWRGPRKVVEMATDNPEEMGALGPENR